MKLVPVIVFLFVIIEVRTQIDVIEVDNNVDLNGNDEGTEFLENTPIDFDVIDEIAEDLPLVDNFLQQKFSEDSDHDYEQHQLREAHADPTLHKWKHKRPLFHGHTHTHIHTITHGNSHDYVTPIEVHPVSHQFGHQSHVVNPPIKQLDYGFKADLRPVNIETNHWAGGPQPHTHLSYNQNLQYGSQAISHQTSQTSNQNNHFGSFGKPTYTSDTLKPGVVNINGNSNTFIQSGGTHKLISSHNGQVFSREKAASPPVGESLVGISKPVEEDIFWHNTPEGPEPQSISANIQNPVVYDTDMKNVLNVLDDRSYFRDRPEVEPSGYERTAEVIRHENSDDQGGLNVHEQEPRDQTGGNDDMNLKSPNLIQIPFNNYFHSYDYGRNSRNKRSTKNINMNFLSDNAMLFNISSWRLKEINSKLDDTLSDYRQVVDEYRKKLTDKREALFTDILDSMIGQFQTKNYQDSNKMEKRGKRSATITKLLNNPDVRLDVPKTLDNIGVITRNAFEDERSPMYHVRQFMGSTKNAVLSAMKIPPQNLVIPSNYEIRNINPEEIAEEEDHLVSGINPKILSRSSFRNPESTENFEDTYPSDPYGIVETFARVGGAIRDSVRSGQNTLNHISNIAHDARKIFHTTKNTVPRVLLPYAKAPVLLTSRFKESKKTPLKKAIIISPKVLDVKDPLIGAQRNDPEFVSMGNIMDAIGLTKPNKDKIDLEKIVVRMPGQGETRGIYIPPIGEVQSVNGKRLPNSKVDAPLQRRNKEYLGRIQDKVASTNKVVKENIEKMKNDISKTIDKTKNKVKTDILQMKEKTNIQNVPTISQRSDGSNRKEDKNGIKHYTKEEEDEIIDKFLYNIFKIDTNKNTKAEHLISLNKNKKDTKYNDTSSVLKRNDQDKEGPLLRLPIGASISDISPNITESVLEETIKNITMDILKEETAKNSIKKNKVRDKISKLNASEKKKANFKKRPKMTLQSRFGEDDEADYITTTPRNPSTLKNEELNGRDEEERKVDEYVLNDVAAPMFSDSSNDEKLKSSWKIGDVLELIEEPSAEDPSNELQSGQNEEGSERPVFSSRNLLWIPEDSEKQEAPKETNSDTLADTVGLNLPPQLMTPFMSRASNTNVEEIFRSTDEDEGNAAFPDSKTINENDAQENSDGGEILGLNLPPELLKPFMARDSNADIDKTFTSDENNEHNVWSDNDEMENFLPLLMMPHRTTKSVKKTLDEFLKKENETRQQILNVQENRLKHSRPLEIQEQPRRFPEPIREQWYIIPPSEMLRKMFKNCERKQCYKLESHATNNEDRVRHEDPMICLYMSENVSVLPRYPGYSQYLNKMEIDHARNGVGEARTSMDVSEALRKPFMGLGNAENIKKFYDEYNKNQDQDEDLFGSEEGLSLFHDD
ncbi:uncharacterized protein LOC123317158 [Coccinella septempunctata]|uniref:uncharacterized protein LOC123317158 n=1 Tax=Coccinella septempunctata TaxID=41139 RepID=UPI001D0967A4|nr:uncharacterized protein LOC123317158 [Coccinella septempunctata]